MDDDKSKGQRRRSLLQEIGIAIIAGLMFGFFYIWLEAYPYIGFFASWAAGTSFCLIFILSIRFLGRLRGTPLFAICVLAGAAGGLTWWFVGHPKLHPAIAAGIGAGYAAIMYLFEEGYNKKNN